MMSQSYRTAWTFDVLHLELLSINIWLCGPEWPRCLLVQRFSESFIDTRRNTNNVVKVYKKINER